MSRFFKVKFLFLLFTIFGFAFLFFYFGKGGLSFHEINLWFLFPILLSAILDLFFGSLRMYVFAKPVAPEVSLYECIIANIASIASAVLTPSQTGGGIACLYFLKKAGCPLTAALALSLINFLFTLMVLIGGGLFLFFIKSSLLTPKLSILIQSAIVFLSLWTVATIFALLFPSPTLSIWQRISSLFHLRKLLLIFEMALKGYSHYVSFYLFKNLDILLKSFFINALLYANKFLIVFFIIKFLNTNAPTLDVLGGQIVLSLLGYTSPTPGGAGVAEIGAGLVMGKIIPEAKIISFVFLWRFFGVYLPLALAGLCLTVKGLLPRKMATQS